MSSNPEIALKETEARYRRIVETAEEGIITIDAEALIDFVNPKMTRMIGYATEEMIGMPLSDFLDDEGRRLLAYYLERRQQGISEQFDFWFVRKDGSELWVYVSTNPLLDENGTYMGALAMFTDINERREAEQLLAWEMGALEAISGKSSMDGVLDELMLGLERELPGALCSVLLLDDDGLRLYHEAAPSLPAAYCESVDGVAIGPAVGSCGTAAYTGQQVIVSDIATDPLWAGYAELALQHGLLAAWSTPILGDRGKVIGTFAVYYSDPRRPRPRELRTIDRAVHIAKIALGRKRAEEELVDSQASLAEANESLRLINEKLERRAAVRTEQLRALATEITYTEERERLRVADALHGDLLQLLASAKMRMEILRTQLRPDASPEDLEQTQTLLSQALEVGRSVIRGLYPPPLHSLGFGPALDWLARQHMANGLEVEVDIPVQLDLLEGEKRVTLFRAADELLVNVRRHAHVDHAKVAFTLGPEGVVQMVVSDSGVGFDASGVHRDEGIATGFGLFSLRERVAAFGGSVLIDSKPGRGCRVSVKLPS
jgi:PAS domain S-box-containing protein